LVLTRLIGAKSLSGSKRSFWVAGAMVIGPMLHMQSVCPSGAALATISVATMPPAPA
jgi:hypothetical protein